MDAIQIFIGWLTSGAMGILDYEILKALFAQFPTFFEKWMNTPKRALAYLSTAGLVAGGYALAVWVRGLPKPVDGVEWVTAWASLCVPAFAANQLIHSAVKDAIERKKIAEILDNIPEM